MNLKQLEVFLTVAECASFSKGAEAAFITQSTASQHISALEAELGIKLLDRTGKGALLTEGGKLLQKHAQKVMREIRAAREAVNRFKGLDEASLRVGGSNIPGTYIIPEALPRLLAMHPGITVTLIEGDSREILDHIERGDMEIGLIGTRFDEGGVIFTPAGRDNIDLYVKAEHPWRARESISPEELKNEPFIMREEGSGTGKTVREALSTLGVNPDQLRTKITVGSNEAVKKAISGGIGVSFLSEVSVRKEVERSELLKVTVRGLSISRPFYLVERHGRQISPAAAAFKRLMQETL